MEGLFLLGGLLGILYLVVLPILTLIAWQRSSRLDEELRVLRKTLRELAQRGTPPAPSATTQPPDPPQVTSSAAPPVVPPAVPAARRDEDVIPSSPPPATHAMPPQHAPASPPAAPEPQAARIVANEAGTNSHATTFDATPAPAPAPASIRMPAASKRPLRRETVRDESPNPLAGLVSWFFQGNPLAKLGVLLLFFGLAYLFKYAADRDMLPIELRLAGAGLLAIGLLGLGWRLRAKVPLYALILQGGAVGALYLTSFAAFRLYALLPHAFTFGLLIVICAASVALAVLQRAQSLAVLASIGGYLAPLLLSTGGGNHVALFSYYALLSVGILAVSLWQAWRPLNLVGFIFTFGVALLWGQANYVPEHYASGQLFLALNLVIFGLLAVMFALRHAATATRGFVDGTLVFGTPLIGYGLQYGLTKHWDYGPAFSALAFAAAYLPLALWLIRRWPQEGRRLALSFLALGAGFATLAIPLALSAKWTALAWALEGLGVLWVGRLQAQPKMAWSGSALLALAAGAAIKAGDHGIDNTSFFLVTITLALTWQAGAWLWSRPRADDAQLHPAGLPRLLEWALWIGGTASWLLMLWGGADRLVGMRMPATPAETDYSAFYGALAVLRAQADVLALLGMSVSAWAWHWLGRRRGWQLLQNGAWLLWPVAAVALLRALDHVGHPLGAGPWATAWLVAAGVAILLLRRREEDLPEKAALALHATFAWGVLALCGSEVLWQLDQLGWGMRVWRFTGLLVFCAASILAVAMLDRRRLWPLSAHPRSWWLLGLLPVLPLALLLLAGGNALDGRVPGFPYLPLLNPLEQAAIFCMLMLWAWQRAACRLLGETKIGWVKWIIVLLAIWWANGMLLRMLAMLGDLSWGFSTLWDSRLVQTVFALAWTLAALACMGIAARHAKRHLWFGGAAVLGVVILKLFLVDSARGGGLARAIAFIGVALLVLLIGYVAPLPPKHTGRDGDSIE